MLPMESHLQLPLGYMLLHPAVFAAWVGMFATALNLLPGGQLDGGHIVYAVAPGIHRRMSRLTMLLLIPIALLWPGWLLWAVLLMATGRRHPPVPLEPELSPGRKLLAALAVMMLVLTFIPEPFRGGGLFSLFR